jgi:hypothetical protein
MKRDRDVDVGDGRPPDELRAILRQWSAPAPPPEIEAGLRQAFRRRRTGRRAWTWGLAVAASLVMVLLTLGRGPFGTRPPADARTPAVAPAPGPAGAGRADVVVASPPSPAGPSPAAPRAVAAGIAARARRVARPEPAVIVEPGQAALIWQLARELQGARFAVPSGPPPRVESEPHGARPAAILQAPPNDEVPRYHRAWMTVETEWPCVHWSL